MPWVTIITWLISYLLSYSKTKDVGKSALIATGVAAAAYYTVEPTNATAIYGDTSRKILGYDPVSPDTLANAGTTGTATNGSTKSAYDLGISALDNTGGVLKSWGAVGTAGVMTTAAAVSDSNFTKYLPWIIAGGLLLVVSS